TSLTMTAVVFDSNRDVMTRGDIGAAAVALTTLAGGIPYAISAAYGFDARRTCDRRDELHRLEARYAERTEPVTTQRERAWQLTRRAADAARADRCDDVREISVQLCDVDSDFRDTVFARDVAIERCTRDLPPCAPNAAAVKRAECRREQA